MMMFARHPIVLLLLLLLAVATAKPVPTPGLFTDTIESLFNRDTSYTPTRATCPSGGGVQVRRSAAISAGEAEYVSSSKSRRTLPALQRFLVAAGVQGDVTKYKPTIGIAFSGGGYRAMLSGAGVFDALDSRTGAGPLSGLLQAADYITGLSGGAWLVGNAAVSGFATIDDLRRGWRLDEHLVAPGNLWKTGTYLRTAREEIQGKEERGFDITVTDLWSVLLKSHLVPEGASKTWSGVTNTPAWRDRQMPFPIIVSEGRATGALDVPTNATVYETSPLEFGSWDSDDTTPAWIPTRWLGSRGSACWSGFDSAAFVMGTSSSLFNSAVLRLRDAALPPGLSIIERGLYDLARAILVSLLSAFARAGEDIAAYPNPFTAVPPALDLVDGGTSGQNIPLLPLLHPARRVDFILAHDAGAFPDGSALWNTSIAAAAAGLPFPPVPRTVDIRRPTFFGCPPAPAAGPLLMYLPNAPWSWWTNTSTFQLRYAASEVAGFLRNGRALVSQGGRDPEWPACVACAVLLRERQRRGEDVGDQCRRCFRRYCWDGVTGGRLDGGLEGWVEQERRMDAERGPGNAVVQVLDGILESEGVRGLNARSLGMGA
ncbi:lysophospholipase 2 [Geopyxis carbonaria]|nr:lysophospholipase 2 [Geopyxis carbonaria]